MVRIGKNGVRKDTDLKKNLVATLQLYLLGNFFFLNKGGTTDAPFINFR